MHLTPREIDKLLLHQAGVLAQKRLARGVLQKVPDPGDQGAHPLGLGAMRHRGLDYWHRNRFSIEGGQLRPRYGSPGPAEANR
jgi:hypothetical protein